MSKKTIPLTGTGGLLSMVNKPNSVFSMKYRKTNGEIGEKIGCIAASVAANTKTNTLNEHKKYNRNGLLRVYQPSTNRTFDVVIDLIVEFNGMTVFHNY